MRSLWRALAADPGYYAFWSTAVALAVGLPAVLVLRELRAIRRAVERR